MFRKQNKPKIHSASVSYNGNTKKFDTFLTAMINDCLNSDWKPFYVEYGEAIPITELSAETIAAINERYGNGSENSVA